jgi:hypothetical protein
MEDRNIKINIDSENKNHTSKFFAVEGNGDIGVSPLP